MTQFINFDVGKSYNRRIEASIASVGCGRYSSHGAPYRGSFFYKMAQTLGLTCEVVIVSMIGNLSQEAWW